LGSAKELALPDSLERIDIVLDAIGFELVFVGPPDGNDIKTCSLLE
jgi:hypothetical protein